jgi:hypothetical protein
MAMLNRISFHSDMESLFGASGAPKLQFGALRINQINPCTTLVEILHLERDGEITPHSTS